MKALLALTRGIDWLTHKFGWIAAVAVIASCFISSGNAVIRFIFSNSSNAWLEIQWYLFAAVRDARRRARAEGQRTRAGRRLLRALRRPRQGATSTSSGSSSSCCP